MTIEQQEKYQEFLEYYDKVQRPLTYSEFEKYNLRSEQIAQIDFNKAYTDSKNNKGVRKLGTVFMPKDDLLNYILKFCERYIKTSQQKVDTVKLYLELCKNFINSYDLIRHIPELTTFSLSHYLDYNYISFSNYFKKSSYDSYDPDKLHFAFIEFLKRYPEKFRIKISGTTFIVEDATQEDLSLKEGESKLVNEVYSILIENKEKYFSIKELSLELTISSTSGIKPVTTHILNKIIKGNPYSFKFDEAKNEVRILNDDEVLDRFELYFKNNQKLFSEFSNTIEEPGFLVFTFLGKAFPFPEAVEYVKTRPIIFIDRITENTDLGKYIAISDEDIVNLKIPDIKYLKILGLEDRVENWIKENCSISFLPYERYTSKLFSDRIKILFPKLIERFSPILNLSNNPNNLFEYTLKQKENEYLISKGLQKSES